MLNIPPQIKQNNLLAWLIANGAVSLAGCITKKPIALSWSELTQIAPELSKSIKNAGVSGKRMPIEWRHNPELLDLRGEGVYQHNIPTPLHRLGVDAIEQFKEGKHWSHQISYKEGIERGLTPEELAHHSNGVFENAIDNMRRGSKEMPRGWGDDSNKGKLQIEIFNELETLQIVCENIAQSAVKGFIFAGVYELILSSLETSLSYRRGEINLPDAIVIVSQKSLQVGLKGAMAGALITGICSYVPTTGIVLSMMTPVFAGIATVSTLFRIHHALSGHLAVQGFAKTIDFPFIDDCLQDLKKQTSVVQKSIIKSMAQEKIVHDKSIQIKNKITQYHQDVIFFLRKNDQINARNKLIDKHKLIKMEQEIAEKLLIITQKNQKLKEEYSYIERLKDMILHKYQYCKFLSEFNLNYEIAQQIMNQLEIKYNQWQDLITIFEQKVISQCC